MSRVVKSAMKVASRARSAGAGLHKAASKVARNAVGTLAKGQPEGGLARATAGALKSGARQLSKGVRKFASSGVGQALGNLAADVVGNLTPIASQALTHHATRALYGGMQFGYGVPGFTPAPVQGGQNFLPTNFTNPGAAGLLPVSGGSAYLPPVQQNYYPSNLPMPSHFLPNAGTSYTNAQTQSGVHGGQQDYRGAPAMFGGGPGAFYGSADGGSYHAQGRQSLAPGAYSGLYNPDYLAQGYQDVAEFEDAYGDGGGYGW